MNIYAPLEHAFGISWVLQASVLTALLLLAAGSCRRTDYEERSFSVPELKNEACANEISTALTRLLTMPNMDGCLKPETIKFDYETRTVTVEYNSMQLAKKNIEHTIAKIGFTANDIPADSTAAAALPAECR